MNPAQILLPFWNQFIVQTSKKLEGFFLKNVKKIQNMVIFKHIKCTEYEMGNIIVFRAVLSFFPLFYLIFCENGVFE